MQQPYDRSVAVVAVGLLCLLATAGQEASAQALGDLECDGCVSQGDIARRAVGAGQLKNGAVRAKKLGRDVRDRLDTIESRFEYVAVSGAAMRPVSAETVTSLTPSGVAVPHQTGDVVMIGDVRLPHGMSIQDMSCTVRDATDDGLLGVSLGRFPLDATDRDTQGEIIVSVQSGGIVPLGATTAPSDYRIVHAIAGSPGVAIVDNQHYQYFLRAGVSDVGDGSLEVALAGCSIRLSRFPF